MQHTREIFNSIYNYFFNQKEETYEVQIRHGGNQWIDEFYEKKEDGRPNYHKKWHIFRSYWYSFERRSIWSRLK
jgi:hypothetical protein